MIVKCLSQRLRKEPNLDTFASTLWHCLGVSSLNVLRKNRVIQKISVVPATVYYKGMGQNFDTFNDTKNLTLPVIPYVNIPAADQITL